MRISSPLALTAILVLLCGCGISSGRHKKVEEEKASVQKRCEALEEELRLARTKVESLQRRIVLMEKAIAGLKAGKQELQEKYERQAAENIMQQIEYRELQDEYRAFKGVAPEAAPSATLRPPEERRPSTPSPSP